MAYYDSSGPGVIERLVDAAWSAGATSADPDDPQVVGFAAATQQMGRVLRG